MYACVCVCLSGYTFLHFSTDLPQIWREHSTGHDTFRGLYMFCVHAMCAHARACKARAHVCIRLFLNGFCPNMLGTYYDSYIYIYIHQPSACVRVSEYVCICSSFNGLYQNLLAIIFKLDDLIIDFRVRGQLRIKYV
jgi:hypothetical protein